MPFLFLRGSEAPSWPGPASRVGTPARRSLERRPVSGPLSGCRGLGPSSRPGPSRSVTYSSPRRSERSGRSAGHKGASAPGGRQYSRHRGLSRRSRPPPLRGQCPGPASPPQSAGRGPRAHVPNDARIHPSGSAEGPPRTSLLRYPHHGHPLLGSQVGELGWVGGVSSWVDKKKCASLPLAHTDLHLAFSLASKFGEGWLGRDHVDELRSGPQAGRLRAPRRGLCRRT